jgi:hypothetical protein
MAQETDASPTGPRVIIGTNRPNCVEVHLSDKEMLAVLDLCNETGLSRAALFRQALRHYQALLHPPPYMGITGCMGDEAD